jgi:hypothetical protein
MFDYETAITSLKRLHQAASAFQGWHKDQAEEFIKVGEYGLALDGIAYAYLNNKVTMPATLFQLFDQLAVTMELDCDPEFDGVAKLRRCQGVSS